MSMQGPSWTCPICGQRADQAAAHMRAEHLSKPPSEDRLGLRKALDKPPARTPRRKRERPARDLPPAEPKITIPEDGAILRMVCATPLERDTLDMRMALVDLQGVRSVGIDLASGTIDLEIGPEVTVPNHVLTLAIGRCKLPVLAAELHEITPGKSPTDDSIIGYLR